MQASTEPAAQSLRTSLSGLVAELRGRGCRGRRTHASPLLLPALLLAYVVAMTVFAAFVRNWAPMHADSTEMVAWGAILRSAIPSIRRSARGLRARGSR